MSEGKPAGSDIIAELTQAAVSNGRGILKPSPALTVRWVRTAIENPPVEPPVLVDGLLRAGELCVLGAPRGIGKSWAAMNLATVLGYGHGYLFGKLWVQATAKVLLCQGEIDEWESSRRWKMLTSRDEPPEGVAETFDRWRVRTTRITTSSGTTQDGYRSNETSNWVDAELDRRLETTIVEHGFDVVVIDPWAVYFSGAENSNDEVEQALDKLRDLAMRHNVAFVILHHLGKGTDVREPEDLWRGASRLADWASTRVTLLPHYTEKQARDQGMTRSQARRYVDVRFLRRSVPTDDFSMALDAETGWWQRWKPPEEYAEERRLHLEVVDVVDALRLADGGWSSQRAAAEALGISQGTARKLLEQAVRSGAIETVQGPNRATAYVLPGSRLPFEEPL